MSPDDPQIELFRPSAPDVPYVELPALPPFAVGSDTSRAAAESQVPHLAASLRQYVDTMKAHPDGLTDHEAAALTGRPLSSMNARRSDARNAGFTIIDSGKRRPTPYGGDAAVWILLQ